MSACMIDYVTDVDIVEPDAAVMVLDDVNVAKYHNCHSRTPEAKRAHNKGRVATRPLGK